MVLIFKKIYNFQHKHKKHKKHTKIPNKHPHAVLTQRPMHSDSHNNPKCCFTLFIFRHPEKENRITYYHYVKCARLYQNYEQIKVLQLSRSPYSFNYGSKVSKNLDMFNPFNK